LDKEPIELLDLLRNWFLVG